ncbi:protein of unknown function [Georgfuchsia toluolica]|uniref:Uncharacterized protein n=1 Tax=Georgfuchsia toluolica TaxID=424218 RepID=A0A916J7C7_9PROT|nr:protein of unknown function [Georgfuchsia toluolica]
MAGFIKNDNAILAFVHFVLWATVADGQHVMDCWPIWKPDDGFTGRWIAYLVHVDINVCGYSPAFHQSITNNAGTKKSFAGTLLTSDYVISHQVTDAAILRLST